VQFKNVETNRFVAVAVDGEAKEYGVTSRGQTEFLLRTKKGRAAGVLHLRLVGRTLNQ
jgi:hypothetical protein